MHALPFPGMPVVHVDLLLLLLTLLYVVSRRDSANEKIENAFGITHPLSSLHSVLGEKKNESSLWKRGSGFPKAAFWIFLWVPAERRMGAGARLCPSAPRGTRGSPQESGRHTSGAGGVSKSAEVRTLPEDRRQHHSYWGSNQWNSPILWRQPGQSISHTVKILPPQTGYLLSGPGFRGSLGTKCKPNVCETTFPYLSSFEVDRIAQKCIFFCLQRKNKPYSLLIN